MLDKLLFNANAAKEYFSNLCVHYRDTRNNIRRDNEGRHVTEQLCSAEYQKFLGMELAMQEVLEYFSKFDLGSADGDIQYGYVRFSKHLARYLMPYQGCPRGSEGTPGRCEESPYSEHLLQWLKSYANNILYGQDDEFICLTRCAYESCIDFLEKSAHEESQKNEPE